MPHTRRRVLCAEPHEDICRLVRTLLEQQGHEVITADSFRECLRRAGESDFDLYMLADCYDDGTGIDLCARLRAENPHTPVLFFSSRAFQRDRERALDSGALAYLIKPDDIFTIVGTVNSILAPRTSFSAACHD